MKSLLGKDSKTAYKELLFFFFNFFEKLRTEGLPASEFGPRILPMVIWSPQDLSSIWKCLNTESGAKKMVDLIFATFVRAPVTRLPGF
jgi:hypothetical protein